MLQCWPRAASRVFCGARKRRRGPSSKQGSEHALGRRRVTASFLFLNRLYVPQIKPARPGRRLPGASALSSEPPVRWAPERSPGCWLPGGGGRSAGKVLPPRDLGVGQGAAGSTRTRERSERCGEERARRPVAPSDSSAAARRTVPARPPSPGGRWFDPGSKEAPTRFAALASGPRKVGNGTGTAYLGGCAR